MKAFPKLLITAVGWLVVTLAVYFFLVSGQISKVSMLNSELKAKKTEAAKLDQQIRAYKNAQSDLSRATQKERIVQTIPTKEDLVNAIVGVEKAAAKTHSEQTLKINEIAPDDKNKPAPVLKNSGLEEVPYRLTVKNDFAGLVNFISYLEHLPQFTEVSTINFSAELTQSGEQKVSTGGVFGNIDGVFVIKGKGVE